MVPLLAVGAVLTVGAGLLSWWRPLAQSRRAPWAATLMLLTATATVGWANARLWAQSPSAPALSAPSVATDTTLRGIVTDEPLLSRTRAGRATYRFPAAVAAVQDPDTGQWRPVSGTLRVLWFGASGDLPAYGDEWQWKGRLASFTPERQGMGPHRSFLTLTVSAGSGTRLSSGNGNPIVAWCLKVRHTCLDLITLGIRDFPEQVGILISLVLGYRSQIPTELYQAFASTGTLHVFAVSGSHVIVIAGAVVFLLSACGLPRTRWVLLLAPILIAYTIMTGLQPSAVRACIMGTAYATAPLFNRRSDLYTSLGLAAILILALTPAALEDLGFILSFVAVLGLGFFYPVFADPLHRRLAPDPLQLQPDPGWKSLSRTVLHHGASLVAMSLAAWVVTTPLTAWYFGLFSPIALPGNLAAVPLSSLIIVTGILSLSAGSLLPGLADLFNHANLVLAALLAGSIRALDAVPYGHLQVGTPPLLAVIGWYAVLVLWRAWLWVNSPPPCATPHDPIR